MVPAGDAGVQPATCCRTHRRRVSEIRHRGKDSALRKQLELSLYYHHVIVVGIPEETFILAPHHISAGTSQQALCLLSMCLWGFSPSVGLLLPLCQRVELRLQRPKTPGNGYSTVSAVEEVIENGQIETQYDNQNSLLPEQTFPMDPPKSDWLSERPACCDPSDFPVFFNAKTSI